MPAEQVEKWLKSGRAACIANMQLRPVEHNQLPGTPLSSQQGQAEAFWLAENTGQRWILKKFKKEQFPGRAHLEIVNQVLPNDAAFACGFLRHVLSEQSLARMNGNYGDPQFAAWLDGTVLMPQVNGIAWAGIADDLRAETLILSPKQRLELCLGFSLVVLKLEQRNVSHRDLSSGNVFIDVPTLTIRLIDFDSLWHPAIRKPKVTTAGTIGYIPPFAWRKDGPDASITWCPYADRFALSLLNVEFLLMTTGSPLTGDGGMFQQDELRARHGSGIDAVFRHLAADYPDAAALLKSAIQSTTCLGCPSPELWVKFCETALAYLKPPQLCDVETIAAGFFEGILKKQQPPAPIWPAPQLSNLPTVALDLPRQSVAAVTLPVNPWA